MSEANHETGNAFAAAVKDLARVAHRQKGGELSVEELRAYLDGEVSPEREEEVKDRLALDPEAASTLLEMIVFREQLAATAGAEVPAADWQAMKERLVHEESRAAAAAGPGRGPTVRRAAWPYWQIAAIVLFAIATGALFWGQRQYRNVQQLRAQVADAYRPHVNVFPTDLHPIDLARQRDPGQGQTIALGTGTERFVLALNVGDPGDYSDYGIDVLSISDNGETMVWSTQGLMLSPVETFNVELYRDFLPAGHYRVQLFGIEGERRDLLETYEMRLFYE